jgi:amino acid permease
MNPSLIKEAAIVFLFAFFIILGSFFRALAMKGREYTNLDILVALILALMLTIGYVFYKKKYIIQKNQR